MANKKIFTILLGIAFIVFGLVVSAVMIPVQDVDYGTISTAKDSKTSGSALESGKESQTTGSVASSSATPPIIGLAGDAAVGSEKAPSTSNSYLNGASQFWDNSMGSFYMPASYMEPVSDPFGKNETMALYGTSSPAGTSTSSGPQAAASLASLASNDESNAPVNPTAAGTLGSTVNISNVVMAPAITAPAPVPEPGTLALVSIGSAVLLIGRRRNAKRK